MRNFRRALSTALLALTLTSLGPAAAAAAHPGPTPSATSASPEPIVGINMVDPDFGSARGGFVITVDGVGFVPGQTGVRLCDVDIPPADVEVDQAGNQLTFTAPPCSRIQTQLLVTTPTGSASVVYAYEGAAGLPVTGGPVWPTLLAGTALTLAGGLALLFTRRRSPVPTHR
ncbi:hypothetical protein AB0J74_23265 [Asanoa sp. NPDC049573]|uniref:hypothetical protein n=1 Tax=Asanoa sp. NPDC049573 TaxID=3155396 RepID=UPI00341E6661